MAPVHNLRLIGSPGTNKIMAGEVARLSKRGLLRIAPTPKKAASGALVYPFDCDLAQLIVNYHRTGTRLLWDLFLSSASRLEPLYDELKRDVANDSRGFCWDGARISVTARNVQGFPAGARQIVGTVKNALVDGAELRGVALTVDPSAPDIHISVRMYGPELVVSVDLVGETLSRHGYRQVSAAAPIREHLAATMVMLSRYDVRREILLDPMAGSGTIAIEAALMGIGAPRVAEACLPALSRFRDLAAARAPTTALFADAVPAVVANEIDSATVRAARANVRSAGVGERVAVNQGDFRDLGRQRVVELARRRDLDGSQGIILCNPPYGERAMPGARGSEQALRDLYGDLAAWCRQFSGWRAGFFVANSEFSECFGLRPRVTKPLSNSGLRGAFYLYDL